MISQSKLEINMSFTRIEVAMMLSIRRAIIRHIAKNPLFYLLLIFLALFIEKIGLSYNNHFAENFACAAAYFESVEPLETPGCAKFVKRVVSQPEYSRLDKLSNN